MITGFSEAAALSCCCGYGLGTPESEKFVPNAWGEIPWRTGGIGFAHYRPGCAPWVWGITLNNAPLPGSRHPFAALSDNVPGKEARIERDLPRDRLPVQDP